MYINTSYDITNTPSHFTAAYNTWTYYAPKQDWFQRVPRYYIDQFGRVREWDRWNPPLLTTVQGGQYKGTPTRTGAFYAQNVIFEQ